MSSDHQAAARAQRTLGEALLAEGDRIGARRALLSALALAAPDAAEVARVERALGTAAAAIGDLAEARSRFAAAHAVLGRDAGWRATIEQDLGALERASGDLAAAEAHLRRALALEVEAGDEQHRRVAAARSRLGALLAERGDRAEALTLLRRALPRLPAGELPHALALSALAVALGDDEDAHAAAVAALEDVLGTEHPDLAPALLARGRLADRGGDPAAGLALSQRAVSVLEGRVVDAHPALAAARDRVAQAVTVSAAVSSRLPLRLSFP